jgi:hypothetical protein
METKKTINLLVTVKPNLYCIMFQPFFYGVLAQKPTGLEQYFLKFSVFILFFSLCVSSKHAN